LNAVACHERICALCAFVVESFPVTPGANATKIQKAKLRERAQELLSGS